MMNVTHIYNHVMAGGVGPGYAMSLMLPECDGAVWVRISENNGDYIFLTNASAFHRELEDYLSLIILHKPYDNLSFDTVKHEGWIYTSYTYTLNSMRPTKRRPWATS